MFLVYEDKRERTHYLHGIYHAAHIADTLGENRDYLTVEVFLRVPYPFFYHTTMKFDIVIVIHQNLTTLLFYLDINIRDAGQV